MIPVFNGEGTIALALASLLVQSVERWEAVVVDDGSADYTLNIVESLEDPRIHLFRFEENRGRGAARRLALEQCSGRFLAMLDADDWWYPWKLERQLSFLEENPDIGLVSSAIASVGEDGGIRGVWKPALETDGARKFPPLKSLSSFSVPHAPCLVRMGLAKSVGFDDRLRRSEDFVFLARVLRTAPHAVLEDVLYAYTDTESFLHEDAFGRYMWSARASLRLVRDYGSGAVMRSARSFAQAALALLRLSPRPLSRSVLRTPEAGETEEFEEARRQVESVKKDLGF